MSIVVHKGKEYDDSSSPWIDSLSRIGVTTFNYYVKDQVIVCPPIFVDTWGVEPFYEDAPDSIVDKIVAIEDRDIFSKKFNEMKGGDYNNVILFHTKTKKQLVRCTTSVVEYTDDGDVNIVLGMVEAISETKGPGFSNRIYQVEKMENNYREMNKIHESMGSSNFTLEVNSKGRIKPLYCNSELKRLFNIETSLDTQIQLRLARIHEDDRNEFILSFRRCVSDPFYNTPWECRHRILDVDNEYHWYDVNASAYRNSDGTLSITGVYVNVDREVKNTKRLNEQLKIVETLSIDYQQVFLLDLIADTIKVIKEDGRYCLDIENIHASTFSEAVPKKLKQYIYEDDVKSVLQALDIENLKKELTNNYEYIKTFRGRDKDKIHYYQYKFIKRSDLRSVIMGIQNIDNSVLSEQKNRVDLEQTRLELEENARLVAAAGLGLWHIVLFNNEPPRMLANAKMLELLGIDPEDNLTPEEVYEFWFDRIKPTELESVNKSVGEMKQGIFSENTYLWIHPDLGEQYVRCGGTSTYINNKGYILRGYHSNVNKMVMDEQMRKKELNDALEAAKKANAAKTSFLARMSHDIRTPLNGIIGLMEIADKHENDLAFMALNRRKSRVAANHLLQLINDVLELSKLEEGNIVLTEEVVNLGAISKDVETIAEMRAIEKGITIESNNTYNQLEKINVYTSPLYTRQIFLNIYGNCIKYNKQNGSIRRHVEVLEKTDTNITIRSTISDSGIGMTKEFLEHIFEPFVQEKSDARSTFQGTGLGMSIVKTLVDKMNGTIEIESEVGVGSTFIVTIPYRIAEVDVEEPEYLFEDEYAKVDIKGKNILLVEDNELNLEVAKYMLEDAEANVICASNGKEAYEKYIDSGLFDIDAILTDVMMPIMNGFEETVAIRSLDRPDAKVIPIIAMTANAFDEDKRKCLESGMNGFISKPVTIDALLTEICKYIKK